LLQKEQISFEDIQSHFDRKDLNTIVDKMLKEGMLHKKEDILSLA
jgi:hypothetical protein